MSHNTLSFFSSSVAYSLFDLPGVVLGIACRTGVIFAHFRRTVEKARRARNANRARGEKLLSSRATGAPLSPGFRPCSLLGSLSPLLKLSNDKNNASEIKTLETKQLVTHVTCTWINVLPLNINVLISVWSVLFMCKSQKVSQLVCSYGNQATIGT